MFKQLPVVLVDLILKFTYDADLAQTRSALNYCLFIKELKLHPCCLNEGVFDYSGCTDDMYCRDTRESWGYFAPWFAHQVNSPLRSFFVWFSQKNLFHVYKMNTAVCDLDFRMVKTLFHDFPIRRTRNYKSAILTFIEHNPQDAAIALTPIFRQLRRDHLCLNATTMGRFLTSSHCAKVANWSKYSIMML
jgi:hypothetical protein